MPVQSAEREEVAPVEQTGGEQIEEAKEAEEEDEDFPAFDEAALPSMDELDRKAAEIGNSEQQEQ